ncbi:hypothetical protein [Nocardia sp. X0981]
MTEPHTISALADFPQIPPGSTELVHHIEQVEIPLADHDHCTHHDTLCAHCVRTWKCQHLFTEPLPWDRENPDATGR